MPLIQCYICLETRLFGGIFDLKRSLAACHREIDYPQAKKKMTFTGIWRQNSWTSDWTWMEEIQEYAIAKHIAWWILFAFWGVSTRKNIRLYPETVLRNRLKVWRKSMRRYLETFLMNNLNSFEFGFRMMWRYMCRTRRMLSTLTFSLGGLSLTFT